MIIKYTLSRTYNRDMLVFVRGVQQWVIVGFSIKLLLLDSYDLFSKCTN